MAEPRRLHLTPIRRAAPRRRHGRDEGGYVLSIGVRLGSPHLVFDQESFDLRDVCSDLQVGQATRERSQPSLLSMAHLSRKTQPTLKMLHFGYRKCERNAGIHTAIMGDMGETKQV